MGEWIKSFILLFVYVLFKFSLAVFATKVIVSIDLTDWSHFELHGEWTIH